MIRPYQFPAPDALGPIFARMGGRYTIGAMRQCDCPAKMPLYHFPDGAAWDSFDVRGSHPARWTEAGVQMEVGFEFEVSPLLPGGVRRKMFVAADPDGTYSIWLVRPAETGLELVASRTGLPPGNTLCNEIIALHRTAGAS